MNMNAERPRQRQGGYSFVEVVVAVAILAIGMLSQASLTVTHVGQSALNKASRLAIDGIHNQIEDLKNHAFADVFKDYQGTPLQHFAVPGLEPQDSDPDGAVGEIIFPTASDPLVGNLVLREDLARPELGLPRDLDGDGAIDSTPKNATYQLLPVMIELRWKSPVGDRSMRVAVMLQPGS